MSKNVFTGEELVTPATQLQEARKAGLALKALHDAELVEYGEIGPNGKRPTRPRSVGQVYDIPPIDGTYCPDRVDQTGKDAVDLNRVMKRFEKTGQIEELIRLGAGTNEGLGYDDFTNAPDFQSAMDIYNHGREQFSKLDAKVRARFNGDPREFMAFVSDPKNADEMELMGLLNPEVVKARQAARSVRKDAPAASGEPQATPPASQAPGAGQAPSTN